MTTPPRVSRSSDGSGRAAILAMPHLSVVVASSGSAIALDACLRALLPQVGPTRAEVVLARAGDPGDLGDLRQTYPEVRLVAVPGSPSVGDLRAAGMRECTGDVVV